MELVEKVRGLLTEMFPAPSAINLDDDDGIVGTVVSPRFEGTETLDRIHLIWDSLKETLTPEERGRVLAVVAATPGDEFAFTA